MAICLSFATTIASYIGMQNAETIFTVTTFYKWLPSSATTRLNVSPPPQNISTCSVDSFQALYSIIELGEVHTRKSAAASCDDLYQLS